MTDGNSAYSQLKLTVGGQRIIDGPGSVSFSQVGRVGHYWSSSDLDIMGTEFKVAAEGVQPFGDFKSSGSSVRCLIN
jgi:hypothetical protein